MKHIILTLLLGVFWSVNTYGEETKIIQYMHDESPESKTRILITSFDGIANATLRTIENGKEEEKTYPIAAEAFSKFWAGFTEIEVLRNSVLSDQTVDTETHYIFIVLDKTPEKSKESAFAVLDSETNEAFIEWLKIITPKKTNKAE